MLGINKLRALFGDSDTSDSGSSTSDSDTEDGSTLASGTNRATTEPDHVSFISSGRRRRRPSSSHRPSEIGDSPAVGPLSGWTPRLTAQKRKKRRPRRSEKEQKLLRMSKPSRKARKNARRLREIAGGTTEYVLYAPLATYSDPVVRSTTWKAVGRRLADFFQYHTQQDGHQGDIGLPSTGDVLQSATPAIDPAAFADDEIDLALPSPALSIHPDAPHADFDNESYTGRHMSDVPLTPFFRPGASPVTPRTPFSWRRTPRFPAGETPMRQTVHMIPEEPATPMDALTLPEPMPLPPPDAMELPMPAMSETPVNGTAAAVPQVPQTSETWWLDVRCPTYRVMQHLSLRFPLHPLTVEDILKQESHEKIESFEGLGYYFVVIRAMDKSYFRFTRDNSGNTDSLDAHTALRESGGQEKGPIRIEMVKNARSKEGLEGVGVGSVNLYLVVFSHGVISFHFEDMSAHTDRVRSRISNNLRPFQINPDWIMYEFYDSIIDDIYPYVAFLEHEVSMIELITNDPNLLPSNKQRRPRLPGFRKRLLNRLRRKRTYEPEAIPLEDMAETISKYPSKTEEVGFNSLDAIHQRMVFQRLKAVREIDTGLSRLLAPKPDVMRGISKRVEDMAPLEEQYSILLYFDDVYDHIMSMLAQLHERDGVLAHAHMVYLNRIRFSNKYAVILATRSLAWCAGVATTVLCCTLVTSTMSQNLTGLPQTSKDANDNPIEEHQNLHSFGTIIAILSTIPVIIYSIYRFLVHKNRQRSNNMLRSH